VKVCAHLEFRDNRYVLYPGDLIGRLDRANLCIAEPSVSEAHALLSYRRGRLWLLSLRRLLAVNGDPVSEVPLSVGLEVSLANGVTLTVADLKQGDEVAALRGPTLGTRVLPPVASLFATTPPRVEARFSPEADAHVWWSGRGWQYRATHEPARQLEPGTTVSLGTEVLSFVTVGASLLGLPTTAGADAIDCPLHLVTHFDSVEIHRQTRPTLVVGGVGARILSELVAFDGPVHWELAAREVWGAASTTEELRHRWDVSLGRLRTRLKKHDVRGDLIRADGGGYVQLVLRPSDRVEDRS